MTTVCVFFFTAFAVIHSKFQLVSNYISAPNLQTLSRSISWSWRRNCRTTSEPIQLSKACCWMGSWRRRHVRVCFKYSDKCPIPIPNSPPFARQGLRSLWEPAHQSGCLTGARSHTAIPIPCRIPIPHLPTTLKKNNPIVVSMKCLLVTRMTRNFL